VLPKQVKPPQFLFGQLSLEGTDDFICMSVHTKKHETKNSDTLLFYFAPMVSFLQHGGQAWATLP
jgi:hypothetical protein